MTQASGEQWNRGLAALWSGLLAVVLLLVGGVARAEPDSGTAWVFDLLARVEQWRPVTPLDFLPGVAKEPPVPVATKAWLQAGYGHLPMHFEPNVGQTADEVKFLVRGPGYTLFLTADEAVLALRRGRPVLTDQHLLSGLPEPTPTQTVDATPLGAVIRTRLEGATRSPAPQPEGVEKLSGISNYFLGNDPAKWRANVPHYQRVRYPNVYPGIDLVYYGDPQRLEHDFIVAPGADPAVIQLAISGADQATINVAGDLVLKVSGGEVVQQAPKIYQVVDGQQQAVAGRYVLRNAAPASSSTVSIATVEPANSPLRVGFEVAQYDRKQPLVIDPVLVYSTYLGGSDYDFGNGIAVDGAGNAYVTGRTYSTNFPIRNAPYTQFAGGAYDAFLVKLNASGTVLVYSTYFGGSGMDSGIGIAVDGAGNAYVTGETHSPDFPTPNALDPNLGGDRDAFIVKLNADGTALVYSTYLGGSYRDYGYDIAVDGAGNAYVTGETWSANFPATVNTLDPNLGGTWDAFIAKLNAGGTALVYSTYLGGSGMDSGIGIAVDGAGNAYVTGRTDSINFPTTVSALDPNFGGASDAFIIKLNASGTALVYSTYLGGSNSDESLGIAVDSTGNAYVTGDTYSADFPTRNAPYLNHSGGKDVFIAKLNTDGTALVYSTYLGGSKDEWGSGIAVNSAGNAYVTGRTYSTNLPTGNALYSQFGGGIYDAFIAKLNASGTALVYSTYFGGGSYDEGLGIALDSASNAYVTGETESANFPTIANALDPNLGGAGDAFIVKIADGSSTSTTLTVSVTGSGTVYSTPGGINCGATCSASFANGTTVMLTATPASGYVLKGWIGNCTVYGNTCTVTMNANTNVSVNFKSQTPNTEDPIRFENGCASPNPDGVARKAIVITHGWNASADDWVKDMAQSICNEIAKPATPEIYLSTFNSACLRCRANSWDVWIVDWNDRACKNFVYCTLPGEAWQNAPTIGNPLQQILKKYNYQHIHFIAHSAGSQVIQTATYRLKESDVLTTIHETFLDAYGPSSVVDSVSNRHISDDYGKFANWVDNYVDIRPLVLNFNGSGVNTDNSDLHLTHGYNIDVTPTSTSDDCNNLGYFDTQICRHSRPYRFYLKSIYQNYAATYLNKDPVYATGQMGFPLSMEAGNNMNLLVVGKDTGCRMDDSGSCSPAAKPTGALQYFRGAIVETTTDVAVGTVNFVKGVGSTIFDAIRFAVSIPTVSSLSAPDGIQVMTATAPTAAPSWLVANVTTTGPTNTLRFSYRFTEGGEGLLRVFVNEDTVREIDQRYVPLASSQPESVYIGELPAGVHRIAFRLDGYGTNPSGVDLTEVELGRQEFVDANWVSCNTVTPQNFFQPAYNGYGAPFDLFGGNATLIDARCSSSDTHTMQATLGIPGDLNHIVYTKGYYYDPSISNWKQYTATCNGRLNGDWCQGNATAIITNPNISTASANAPTYFVGMACSVQGGQWRCGCRDTTCTNFYWMLQGAGQ